MNQQQHPVNSHVKEEEDSSLYDRMKARDEAYAYWNLKGKIYGRSGGVCGDTFFNIIAKHPLTSCCFEMKEMERLEFDKKKRDGKK